MSRKQFLLTLSVAIISAFLGGTLGVWSLMPQGVLAQDEPQKVIEAEEFRLVDSGGTTRATLGLSRFLRDSVGLYLFNEDGKVRVELEHSSVFTSLILRNDDGTSIAGMAIDYESNSRLQLQDYRGDTEISPGAVVLFDEEGKVVWSAP